MSTKRKKTKTFEYHFDPKRVMRVLGANDSDGAVLDWRLYRVGSVIELDRQWFLENPGRSLRLRRMAEGELPLEGSSLCKATHAVVRQVQPGWREKRPVPMQVSAQELDALADSEALLESIWSTLADPRCVFTVRDVLYPAEHGGVH